MSARFVVRVTHGYRTAISASASVDPCAYSVHDRSTCYRNVGEFAAETSRPLPRGGRAVLGAKGARKEARALAARLNAEYP